MENNKLPNKKVDKSKDMRITFSKLNEEGRKCKAKLEEEGMHYGIFTAKSMNDWLEEAKLKPIPNRLFDVFWYEYEICLLFADTNVGKSILAVQIADSISRGTAIEGFSCSIKKQPVAYFDFELTSKQLENRYSEDYKNHYVFDPNLRRIELEYNENTPDNHKDLEDYLHHSLEEIIIETGIKILIIDNITYLKGDVEQAKDALPLMKKLKALQGKYEVSILILAHTPKRDLSKPISEKDIKGSSMLMNFCDSSFAIGQTPEDKGIKYIKQIKVRNGEHIYDSTNVAVCQIVKNPNFLGFEFIHTGNENEFLKTRSQKETEQLKVDAKQLSDEGFSQRKIGEQLGISAAYVNKLLKS